MTKKKGLDSLLDFAEKAVSTMESVLPSKEELTHDESDCSCGEEAEVDRPCRACRAAGLGPYGRQPLDVPVPFAHPVGFGVYKWICIRELSGWSWHATNQEAKCLCGRTFTAGLVGPQRLGKVRGMITVCGACLMLTSDRQRTPPLLEMGQADE